jgi:hypothetical protein
LVYNVFKVNFPLPPTQRSPAHPEHGKIGRMTPEKPGSVPELKKAMDLHRAFWPAIP